MPDQLQVGRARRNSSSRTPASSPAFVQRAMANGLNLFLLIISILEILLLQIGYVRCARIHKKLAPKVTAEA